MTRRPPRAPTRCRECRLTTRHKLDCSVGRAAATAAPDPPDDGVRDRTADPEVLARLLRLALRHLVTDLPAELRWTAADLLAAGHELDLRVTVTYGLGGPADDPVTVHLDRRDPRTPPTEPPTQPPTDDTRSTDR